MEQTNWLEKARRHQENVDGLLDGSIGKSDLWNPSMTLNDALAVEKRNVIYCLRMAEQVVGIR